MGVLTARGAGRARIAAAVAALFAIAGPAAGFETDQFFAWRHPLRDSETVLDLRINAEIEGVLARIDRGPGERLRCEQVTGRIVRHMRKFLFQSIENYAVTSPEVDKYPATDAEMREFERRGLYHHPYLFDTIGWMPKSPTIEVAGIRMGTDKLNHFFAQGAEMLRVYRWNRREGRSRADAERSATRWTVQIERTVLGLATSGVLSQSDLEANAAGMRFYVGLCEGDAPQLVSGPEGWRLSRPFALREYVTPEWDESFQPSLYTASRWRMVEPRLRELCPLLDDPWVTEQRRRYRAAERPTALERVIEEMAAEGRFQDPRQFSIERVCGREGSP